MRRIMLALFGRERTARVEPEEDWDWIRSHARRWWLVEAPDSNQARLAVTRHECDEAPGMGRVLDCGRNALGGATRALAPSCYRTATTRNRATRARETAGNC